MNIILHEGESIKINFDGTDGEITVRWTDIALEVEADMSDSTFGREGIIYREVFGHDLGEDGV